MKNTLEELGKLIRLRRQTLSITQQYLADMAGLSVNTLYKIERGQGNPTITILEKLADALGMEVKLEVKRIDI